MKPTAYRESCPTAPAKAGNVVSTLVLSPGEREVDSLRKLVGKKADSKRVGKTWTGEGEDLT